MTAEHKARMLEHLTSVKAALDAHEPPKEGQWMNPKTTLTTPNTTGTAEPADDNSGAGPALGSPPPTATTAGFEAVLLQSASIGQLALALSRAQGEIKAPTKGKTAKIKSEKASYDYKYADLADVIEAYRPALAKNGLALVQPLLQRDGHLVLVTRLLHGSGEWLQSEYPISLYQRPQEQGSAITYARRYTVSSLLGIAAEDDDDGQRAQDAQPHRQEEEEAPVDADSAAIVDVAMELSQHNGRDWLAIIRTASEFKGDKGDQVWFENPSEKGYAQNGTKVVRTTKPGAKWKAGVRRKLEDELRKLNEVLSPVTDADVPF